MAQRGFKRAIELSPSYPTAPHWYSYLLLALGRFDEALANIRRAMNLDPLSLIINAQLAWGYHFARRFDEAIQQAKNTLEMDPNFGIAHLWLGLSHVQLGSYEEGIRALQSARRILAPSPTVTGVLAFAYGVSGNAEEANQLIGQMTNEQKRYVPPVSIAIAKLGLGEIDESFVWLEKSVEDRSWWLAWLKVDPLFDRARSDPRFDPLMARIGLV
jgi:tetratricopeptide (TPR) repeat protein